MNIIALIIYILLVVIYFLINYRVIIKLINNFKHNDDREVFFRKFLVKMCVFNLIGSYIIVTVLINVYENIYNLDYGSEILPPIATGFSFACFVILLICTIVFLARNKYKLYTRKSKLTELLYDLCILIIIIGTTTVLTSVVSLLERLIFGYY